MLFEYYMVFNITGEVISTYINISKYNFQKLLDFHKKIILKKLYK